VFEHQDKAGVLIDQGAHFYQLRERQLRSRSHVTRASPCSRSDAVKKSQTALEERRLAEEATRAGDMIKVEPLLLCPNCKIEMRLFGCEQESAIRDVFSFECISCGRIEGRSVLLGVPSSAKH
jgi:hypothetical protein